jgi:DNA-binding CsgD family transcriptional regulator
MLNMLAVAAGAASVSALLQLHRIRRSEMLRDHLWFLLVLNLCVAFNLVASYLESTLAQSFLLTGGNVVMNFLDTIGLALVGGIVYRLIRLLYSALGSHAPRWVGRIIWGVVILVAAALTVVTLSMPTSDICAHLHIVPRITNLLLISVAATSATAALAAARGLSRRRKRAVRWFAGLHLGAFIAILLGFFSPPAVAWPLLAGSFLGINLIPFSILRSSGEVLYVQSQIEQDGDISEDLRVFAAAYGISARELDVVAQALTGKTNAEMADALHISASTVKNHLHSIYCKCGVRNRVELARLLQVVPQR